MIDSIILLRYTMYFDFQDVRKSVQRCIFYDFIVTIHDLEPTAVAQR